MILHLKTTLILYFFSCTMVLAQSPNWITSVLIEESMRYHSVEVFSVDTILIFEEENGIRFSSFDNGNTWQIDTIGFAKYLGFDMENQNVGWMSRHLQKPIITSDGGFTWSELSNSNLISVSNIKFISSNIIWMTDGQGVYKTTNTGITFDEVFWEPGLFRKGFFKNALEAHISRDVFGEGSIVSTFDGGQSWIETLMDEALLSVDFIDNNRGYAVGEEGVLYATNDGGLNWSFQESLTNETLYDIMFKNEHGVIVGESGLIYITEDGGLNWATFSIPSFTNRIQTAFIDDHKIIVGGHDGIAIIKDQNYTELTEVFPLLEDILYPNPGQQKIYLKADVSGYRIYDIKGRLINNGVGNEIQINKLSKGTYIIDYENNGTVKRKKFIKN